jgi:hypothetical protein
MTALARAMVALKARRVGEAKKRLEFVLAAYTPDWRQWT